MPFKTLIKKFDLEPNTTDFIGHAVALYSDDLFLDYACIEVINKIKLYMDSHGRYGESPFIYPIYGLGGIPEGFSRMCAVFGGTFMLQQGITDIVYDGGKVVAVKDGPSKTANTKILICNPIYLLKTG